MTDYVFLSSRLLLSVLPSHVAMEMKMELVSPIARQVKYNTAHNSIEPNSSL